MEKRYFGTDGIRGQVGKSPITPEFVLKLGWAAGRVLSDDGGPKNKILIGKDTRVSGYLLESALEAGLSAAGVDIRLLGPMPTPAIAYLTRTARARAGIVISASHNPFDDNGIKFFSSDGTKLADDIELAIEAAMDEPLTTVVADKLGKAKRYVDASGRYIEFCKSTFPTNLSLEGLTLAVDCANGAAYQVAPLVFSELGANVIPVATDPDGFNINADCGSTFPKLLQKTVVENQADLGIALDGDGDRVIMVDHKGQVIDGDQLLFVIAVQRHQQKDLKGGVVGTLMSNLGLEQACAEHNIPFERASVGDRYVMSLMKDRGWDIGGESSGHIICLNKTTTGDGIIAALQVLAAVVSSGKPLSELKQGMRRYPQVMVNVRTDETFDVESSTQVKQAVTEVESLLADRGRVLLRASGTEPVIRVMVEGDDATEVARLSQRLADTVKAATSV
ncbi:MAG: phosphoglucosamine mutase [Acidiferrobacterales bacterium]